MSKPDANWICFCKIYPIAPLKKPPVIEMTDFERQDFDVMTDGRSEKTCASCVKLLNVKY
jgi:hypothetical protein